jgi:hypothetical protein
MQAVWSFILSGFGWYHHRHTTSSTSETKTAGFCDLPTELVLDILSYLDPVDTALLAHCNQSFHRLLGNRHLSVTQRQEYLTRIARDFPTDFACPTCFQLHKCRQVKPPSSWARQSDGQLTCMQKEHSISHLGDYTLRFAHVQLAMLRHRQGWPYGTSHRSLHATQLSVYDATSPELLQPKTLFSMDTRIIDDELYLRVQHIQLFDPSDADFIKGLRFGICDHIWDTGDLPKHIARTMMQQYWQQRYLKSDYVSRIRVSGYEFDCVSRTRVFGCAVCSVRVHVELGQVLTDRLALITSKWMNLGHGVTPEDEKWRRHQSGTVSAENRCNDEGYLTMQLFERQSGGSLDALTRGNLKALAKARPKKGTVEMPFRWALRNRAWVWEPENEEA